MTKIPAVNRNRSHPSSRSPKWIPCLDEESSARFHDRSPTTLLDLYFANHFLRQPFHALQRLCGAGAAHVKDQGIDTGITIILDIANDLIIDPDEPSSLAGNGLFFAIVQRTFERHANGIGVPTGGLSKA